MVKYTYLYSTDFTQQQGLAVSQLQTALETAGISISHITVSGNESVKFFSVDTLTTGEIATMASVISSHIPVIEPVITTLENLTIDTLTLNGISITQPLVVFLKDVKSIGTNGGDYDDDGGWVTRDLNTQSGNGTFVTLSTNQITLQPGKYRLDASCPGYKIKSNQCRLYNITNSTVEIVGSSEYSNNDTTKAYMSGLIVVSSVSVYIIQHKGSKKNTGDGLGRAVGFTSEVYTEATITKLE